ncbi:Ubiquitin carboxyl-terminal hydrolase 14 [Lunasporangiospora selenospora]|uniref:Ubiquitin carboxyl-terminal hydrolase 14 n=1 Tax=Lunasporangiospora selenospora TaxID=979761 RepID=A0A9P6G4H6_9FUNG|nr:Ubiquitin carboxyl-terminal hydrolase 14 [Lunasporangiospora selenospora]
MTPPVMCSSISSTSNSLLPNIETPVVILVSVKWSGKKFDDIELNLDEPGLVFKAQLFALTGVDPTRQKIILKGGMLKDDTDMKKLGLKPGHAIMMMGTAGELPKAPEKKTLFAEDMSEASLNKALDIPAGLLNLGNTCYMVGASGINNADAGASMTASLRDLYKQLNSAGHGIMPMAFLTYLRKAFPQFSQQGRDGVWMQQDAEECWSQLITTLRGKLPPHSEGEQNVISQFMQGEFTTTLQCVEAPEETPVVTIEPFNKLDCFISGEVNYLHNGIMKSLDQEIEKNSASLGRSAKYSKSQRISRLPGYVTVNFVRFFWKPTEQVKAKILRKVKFPLELDASQFCTPELQSKLLNTKDKLRELESAKTTLKRRQRLDQEAGKASETGSSEEQLAVDAARVALKESLNPELVQDKGSNPSAQYELASVLTHIGRTADSGHYIGWARKGDTDEWYKYDDDKVSPVTEEEILKLDGGDVKILRQQFRITGSLAGSLPRNPLQNIFQGLPLRLLPVEVYALLDAGLVDLVLEPKAYQIPTDQHTNPLPDHDGASGRYDSNGATTAIPVFPSATSSKNASSTPEAEPKPSYYQVVLHTKSDRMPWFSTLTATVPNEQSNQARSTEQSPPETEKGLLTDQVRHQRLVTHLSHLWNRSAFLPPQELDRWLAFKHLWADHRFFLGPGFKFGGDFLLYKSDPLICHSSLIASVRDKHSEVPLTEMAQLARLATSVQKQYLLCSLQDPLSVESVSNGTRDSEEPSPTSSPLIMIAVEWAGF